MKKVCPNCAYVFKGGDKLKATIITHWIELKSEVTYALGQPEECLDVCHQNCNYPQTGEIDGD